MGGYLIYTLLGHGRLTSSLANLDEHPVPDNHTRIVKSLTFCNITANPVWFTLVIGDENVYHRFILPGHGSINHEHNPYLDQVMEEGTRITGRAEVNDAIDYRISGTEWEQGGY
jgi:hypothetical protein